jgi:hypothetical protein
MYQNIHLESLVCGAIESIVKQSIEDFLTLFKSNQVLILDVNQLSNTKTDRNLKS